MSTRLELLEKTREYLSDPAHWTQGCGWRDDRGEGLPMAQGFEGDVASACIAGAICLVDENKTPLPVEIMGEGYHWRLSPEGEDLITLMDEHLRIHHDRVDFVTGFNDQAIHEEVLSFLDEMIELEQTFCRR